MSRYYELVDRASHGPLVSEEDWDLERVAGTVRRLVRKYKLSWDPNQIVTDDPGLADAIFTAGLELARTTGIYARSTGRIIEFSTEELEQGLRGMPQALVMGEGKDARTLFPRKICDEHPPLIWAGNPGAPIPENLFKKAVLSYVREPIVDLACSFSLTSVNGIEVRTGGPMEIVAVRREMLLARSALREAGRPGMAVLAAASAVSEIGDLSVANPTYMPPSDAHLVPMLNELKMDNGNLARAVNSIEYGVRNASLPCVIVGGLGGDAPGCAVVNVASFILANLVCLADYHILHPIHVRHVATSTRAVMWVENIVAQAFSRNAPCILVSDIYPKSGAMTRELLYETAANAIVNTISGGHLEGPGAADGAAPNCSGLEARWMGEVGQAVTRQRMTLPQANELVLKLLPKYEHIFNQPGGNPGLPFDKVYDLETLQPIPEWLGMYQEVKQQVKEMGLVGLI